MSRLLLNPWLAGCALLGLLSLPMAVDGAEKLPADEIKLTEASWDDVQELVTASKGKIVVLDIWSTACQPCMEEFPHLVRLQRSRPDVVCIAVSVDYAGIRSKPPKFYRERVEEFLREQKAGAVQNFLCNLPADELFDALDLDSIPAVYVYGADGKVAKRFDNTTPSKPGAEGISYETQILPFVEQLQPAPKTSK